MKLIALLVVGIWSLGALAQLSATSETELPPDLEKIAQKADLEDRVDDALDYAESMLDYAKAFYRDGDWDRCLYTLRVMEEAVEIAYEALLERGKDPRRDRHFKKTEIRVRRLTRLLSDFQETLSYLERPQIDPILKRLEEIHEDLLMAVMGIREPGQARRKKS